MEFPKEIEIAIDGWTGTTRDGRNEEELVAAIDSWCTRNMASEIEAVQVDSLVWVALVAAVACALIAVSSEQWWMFLGTGGLTIFAALRYQDSDKRRAQIREEWSRRKEHMTGTLRATLAELVDFLRQFARADVVAEGVRTLLAGLSPEQFALAPRDSRSVIIPPGQSSGSTARH